MGYNVYLEKAASIAGSPISSVGSVVRSAKDFAGKRKFGFKTQAKTPLIQRIKASLS